MNANGTLFSFEELLQYERITLRERQEGKDVWPWEYLGQEALYKKGKMEFSSKLVEEERDWFAQTYSVDWERMRQEVDMEYKNPANQEWLLRVKNAQETLDPEVDKLLDRLPIKSIVFDIGGVLHDHPTDDEIFTALAEKLGILDDEKKRQKFFKAVDEYTPKSQTGELGSEEYLRELWEAAGVEFPGMQEAADLLFPQDLYKPHPGMQKIVETLAKRGVDIWCLSDVASAISPRQLAKMIELYPQIDPSHILQSSELGASKENKGAFQKLLERLGNVERGSILFIDNKEKHTTTARSRDDGIRALTFREDPVAKETSTGRLRGELAKAGLV